MKIKNDDKIHKNTVSEKGGIMRLPRPVQAALAAVWIAIVCVCFFNRDRFSVDEVLRFTPSEPWLAAVIMLLLFALKSLSVVVYCGILYAADGILFPLPVAILMNILGTAVMVSVPYFIGRRRGGDIPAPTNMDDAALGEYYGSAVFTDHVREFPDVAQTDGAAHGGQNKSDAAAELFPFTGRGQLGRGCLFRHKFLSFPAPARGEGVPPYGQVPLRI